MFDIQQDLMIVRLIRESLLNTMQSLDDSRLIVTMSASESSGPKLRGTIPHLLEQAEASGLHLDMIIGMNHGAPHKQLVRNLLQNRCEIVDLFTYDQVSEMGVELLFDDPFLQTDPYLFSDSNTDRHRVHIVDQVPSHLSKGKNRMLKPIYDAIQKSILDGKWRRPPRLLLEVDDESRFFSDDPASKGLDKLIEELRVKNLDAIGARIRSCVYTAKANSCGEPTAIPDESISVMPEYHFLDECQHNLYRVMAGGGTLGMTELLTAVRWPISHRYPGARADDLLRTVLINEMDVDWQVADHAYVYNECRNSREQMLRWLCSGTGVMHHLGKEYIHRLVHDPYGTPEIWKRFSLSIKEMNDFAKAHPDSLTGSCDW